MTVEELEKQVTDLESKVSQGTIYIDEYWDTVESMQEDVVEEIADGHTRPVDLAKLVMRARNVKGLERLWA